MGIIIPRAEAGEFRVVVEQSTREGEGLEAGICVVDDIPELVVVDAMSV